jgi:ATP-binding cassette subfamily F protein uup
MERELERLGERERALHDEMAASATDHGRLRGLDAELRTLVTQREALEGDWLELSEALES